MVVIFFIIGPSKAVGGMRVKPRQQAKPSGPLKQTVGFFIVRSDDPMSDGLGKTREEIQRLDEELVCLLLKRRKLALDAGQKKFEIGLPIHDPAREERVLAYATQLTKDPAEAKMIQILFKHIIRICREEQYKLN
jgi:chorismate mutase